MPGFDGTGPAGLGPLTGRGMGYCAVELSPWRTKEIPHMDVGLPRSVPGFFYPYPGQGFGRPLMSPMMAAPLRTGIWMDRGFRRGMAHRRSPFLRGW